MFVGDVNFQIVTLLHPTKHKFSVMKINTLVQSV